TGLLNFSHDKLIMLGAYVFAGQFVLRMGAPPAIAIIATVATMFLFGVLVATGIFNPLRNMASPVFAVIGTVILGRILTELARVIWGATPFTVPGFLKGIVKIGSIVIPRANIAIILVSAVIVTALQIFFKTTKMGKAMRCVQQNKTAATLMGINVTANINLTIALSAVICSAIGILVIPLFTIDLTIANMIGLKGFAAGVIGGFGYLPGAIAGGILIGILENLSTLVIPTLYKDCVAFVLLIVFLLVKPSGLLGHRQ
ncbi:MAG: branched-chain amino acid ABC transporter permease, partial [Anaerotruncus colihominis]